MVYFIIVIILLSIWDIRELKRLDKGKKDIFVYIIFMVAAAMLGIFYFSNPERDSFSEILLSLIGQEG
ncbi:MAG: hypothetical protein GX066_04855 [Clostridiaceae bacterium]|nr:hypothetical protein [Clostridiaceae bacterium]